MNADSLGDNTPAAAARRIARVALLAALASIHPSRRRPPAGFVVADDPRLLSRDAAIDALALLPKPVLLHPALRSDGTVRLSRPRTRLADAIQRHLAEAGIEDGEPAASGGALGPDVHQLLVRAGGEEFLLSVSEYYAFCREYRFLHGGHAIADPDAAARAQGADATLTFDPADRAA